MKSPSTFHLTLYLGGRTMNTAADVQEALVGAIIKVGDSKDDPGHGIVRLPRTGQIVGRFWTDDDA